MPGRNLKPLLRRAVSYEDSRANQRSTEDTRRVAYEDLRANGVNHDAARAGADETARGVADNLERHFGGAATRRPIDAGGNSRSRFRVRFPWEDANAGLDLSTPRGEV